MFLIIPILGINFVLSFLGNIFLLIFLLPLLLIIIAVLRFNSIKNISQTCMNCGLTSIGNSEQCIYCGAILTNDQVNKNFNSSASEKIIEIDAEEIK